MAWQPNGGGCSTDNSVAGGNGGYMSFPQPPSPSGKFNPAGKGGTQDGGNSWNGQFGSVNTTLVTSVNNYFSIFNPGRSS